MFFSFLLLVVTALVFFAVKAKTFDRLRPWSQLTIIGAASLVTATLLTMQFFIAIRRTLIAFLEAIQGVPAVVVGAVFVVLLVLVFPLVRLLGRMNMDQMKRYWYEDIRPKQKMLFRSALDLARSFTWERTRALFSRVRHGGQSTGGEDRFSGRGDGA